MRNDIHTGSAIARQAHALADLGYHLVPIVYGEKKPLIRWKESPSSHEAIDSWFSRFGTINVAIHAGRSGVVVLDADRLEAAAWIESHCPATPMTVTTPRGDLHAYYRASEVVPRPAQNLFGLGLDVKSASAIVLASPSWSVKYQRHWEWRNEIVRAEMLPILDAALVTRSLPPPFGKPNVPIINSLSNPRPSTVSVRDVTKWVMEVNSIQGRGGSNQCFKVACRLVDAGLGWDEARSWLCYWNGRKAELPWSEAELWHKLRDA
jgi:hypothetical protein